MLTEDQVQVVADEVLGTTLQGVGFIRAEVKAGEDETGERALFVVAHFRSGADAMPGSISSDAISALRSRLLSRGEQRFPYVDFDYEGDGVDQLRGRLDAPQQ